MVRAGCLEPRLSLKYDSKNLDACSLTHLFAFSLEWAIVAGLVTEFWSSATAAFVADCIAAELVEDELVPNVRPFAFAVDDEALVIPCVKWTLE